MLGLSSQIHMLLVCHCYKENDRIRIISARKANLRESRQYGVISMREHYDFSDGIKNPYADRLKKQVTIRLDDEVIDYFKNMAEETGMPYQSIINCYLKDCVKEKRHLEIAFSK